MINVEGHKAGVLAPLILSVLLQVTKVGHDLLHWAKHGFLGAVKVGHCIIDSHLGDEILVWLSVSNLPLEHKL